MTAAFNRATLTIAGQRREFFATADGVIFESVSNGSCPQIGVWPRWGTRGAPLSLETVLKRLLPETHECAQCKNAEQSGSHACGYFVGRMPVTRRSGPNAGRDAWAPYRGWLCEDHAEVLWIDGYELKMVKGAN